MAALRKPFGGLFNRGGGVSDRATAAAFKVGQRSFKKNGVSPELKELMRLYRDNGKSG